MIKLIGWPQYSLVLLNMTQWGGYSMALIQLCISSPKHEYVSPLTDQPVHILYIRACSCWKLCLKVEML